MTSILLRTVLLGALIGTASIVGQMIADHTGALTGAIGMAMLAHAIRAHSGQKVMRWLDDFTLDNIPTLTGWWDDLAAKLFRYLRLHQRQQQALSNALQSFRTAAQALPDGVVTLDANGHITWCNAKAQQHLGLKLSTDIDQPLINLVRNPNFLKYMANQQWENPLKISSPRSRSKILSIQLVSYGDQQVLLLSRDITKIEKLERMRQDFIANVSHELKTPLTVLRGFLETIRDLPLNREQQREYIELMYSQAHRMQNLVEDLLTLSSLEAAPAPQDLQETVLLSALAQKTLEDALRMSNGQHQITAHIEPNIEVFGNAAELFSALSNTVTNAVRYTLPQGSIHISLNKPAQNESETQAIFSVKDTGIGVSAEHIPRLTERFYRVDRGRSREQGGTGLGLAIVKHVVQRHGGQLDIQSKPNEGSTFTIKLPMSNTRHKT